MAQRDIYHNTVIAALVKDGWQITDDPLVLKWGQKDLYIDLGAEELVAAEKRGRQIAVEIKSFVGPSEVEDLKNYALFEEPIGRILLENQRIQLLIFDPAREVVVKWIE